MAYAFYPSDRSASAMAGAQDLFAQTLASFVGWNRARRTRAALSRLSDYELEDIGLARSDIERVAYKGSL